MAEELEQAPQAEESTEEAQPSILDEIVQATKIKPATSPTVWRRRDWRPSFPS